MKLTWLGTGTINSFNNYHTNALFTSDKGENLLFDCGGDIRFALHDLGYKYSDIDNVYISHLHGDHCGGLEWLGFCRYFDPSVSKPNLYISYTIKNDLWGTTLSGGMKSLQGTVNSLESYFNVCEIVKNGSFIFGSAEFQLVQSIHIMDGFTITPCFGLMANINGKNVYLTADSQFCPSQIMDFYNMADVIFHDCEIFPFKSGVHANYMDLKTLPKEIKEKMWLVHYQEMERPDAEGDGFKGFVEKGQKFIF